MPGAAALGVKRERRRRHHRLADCLDARRVTSNCASVALQQVTLRVSADVVIYADQFSSVNGLTVLTADGAPHSVQLLVPGEHSACSSSTGINLSAHTTFDPLLDVRLSAPGTVTTQDATTLTGSVNAGCISSSGKVTASGDA